MADKAIRVAVLEGDFTTLCALGFPLSLGVQLQQSCLKLSEAHWTAKSNSGGFSVSFFWPAPENVNKVQLKMKKKRKRKRRQRGKVQAQATHVTAATPPKESTTSEPPKPSSFAMVAPVNPDKARLLALSDDVHDCASASGLTDQVHQDDVTSDSSVSPSTVTDESAWTQVSRKRRPRLPPCWKL